MGAVRLIGLHLIAGVGGFLAWRLAIPLPWMIGPLITVAIIMLLFDLPALPRIGRYIGQTIVASAVGLYLTTDALRGLVDSLVAIVLSAGLTIVAGCLIAILLARTARVGWATALFAGIPGGPVEMATLAEQYGGVGTQVAFAQTLRIAAIVLLVPPAVIALGGATHGSQIPTPPAEVHLLGLAVMLAAVGAAGTALHLIKASNPYFLGPMIVVGTITASGHHLSGIPTPLLAAGQVLLGISLGGMFRRQNVVSAAQFLATAVWTTVLLLLLCVAIAALLWQAFGFPFATAVLSTAPGSLTEMVVTAGALSLNVPLVAAFHVTRIFLILAFVPLAYGAMSRFSRRRS